MSENINNREYRKNVIKEILNRLHEGKSVEEVKSQFQKAFAGVSASEISEAEQALIAEGLPVEEVQKLCDVHASIFKGSIEQIHGSENITEIPGHPANILIEENRKIESIIKRIKNSLKNLPGSTDLSVIKDDLNQLTGIDKHYSRKENLLFPFLEKYGITAPPKVMWGVDDEIRALLKDVISTLSNSAIEITDKIDKLEILLNKITEMVFKEENILLPMLQETLTQDEWKQIADQSYEIGFMIDPIPFWDYQPDRKDEVDEEMYEPGVIKLPTGVFHVDELTNMLNTLPFDITFVDKDDIVKYFSQSEERIFPRTKSIIGRTVSNCHPPGSVHIVEKIVEDFKLGKKSHEDFWIKMGNKYILIRYFAVHDDKGKYIGVVEVTQNIKPIQKITGEKRLVSE